MNKKINNTFKQIPKGFKQTDIGLIPEDWDYSKLGDEHKKLLITIRNGCTEEQNDIEGDYLVSRIETISEEKIDLTKTKFVKEITEDKIDKYLIKKGDILFSHINSDPHLGKSALAYKDYDNLLHGMNLLLFHPNEDVLAPEFLNYIFNYYRRIGIFLKIRSSAVNQSSINQGKLKSLEIPLPPLSEQKKIAHILSKIQQAIEIQEKIIKTTQELKKALMQKLFTEGLNGELQKQTEIGLIPESWEVVLFKEIAVLQGGFGFKSTDKVLESNTQLVRMGNLYQNLLQLDRSPVFYPDSFTKKYPEYVLNENDLIISLTGTMGKEDYGFVVKVPKVLNIKLLLNQRVARIVFNDQNKVDLNYFYYFLLNRKFLDKLYRTAKGTKQANLSVKEIYNLKIAYPKFEEQKLIGGIFQALDKKLNFAFEVLFNYKTFFSSSLNQLMTGQIRVKDIEFELGETAEAVD